VAALGQRTRHGAPLRLALALGDERLDPRELRARVDRADVGVLIERVADLQALHAVPELRDHRLGDGLLDQQP
jgi:hypothetical protein